MCKVEITETLFRDAQQSLFGSKMTTAQMLPICKALDKVGYYSIEAWGGATFDACIRYLNENPWERLRAIKKQIKNTKLQMLLRGNNLVGYNPYSPIVVEQFIKKSIQNGIDIIRVFDALNDVNNMKFGIECAKKYGAIVEGTICYTISPFHTTKYYVEIAKKLQKLGVDNICIKDMAGLLNPTTVVELVEQIKCQTNLPIHLHIHDTNGQGIQTYISAIKAGVDIIDCATNPFGGGLSQPSTQEMILALQSNNISCQLDVDTIYQLPHQLNDIYDSLVNSCGRKVVNSIAVQNQIPGGMYASLIMQLKEYGALEKLDIVLKEIGEIRSDFGYPPLVTPTSQIVAHQAVLNVLFGRYKKLSLQTQKLVCGEYGVLPACPNQELLKKCKKMITKSDKKSGVKLKKIDVDLSEKELTKCMFNSMQNQIEKIFDDSTRVINVIW